MEEKYFLRLYISKNTEISQIALENLKKICNEYLKDKCEIEIIDATENPEMAEEDKILAIPTLVKKMPPPVRKIIGDLMDKEKVITYLDLFSEKGDK